MLLCMFGTTVKAGKESKTGWFSEGQYLRKSNLTLLWEDYEKAFSSQKKVTKVICFDDGLEDYNSGEEISDYRWLFTESKQNKKKAE